MNRLWVAALAVIALIYSLSPPVEAGSFVIDRFTTFGNPPAGWNAGITSQAQVADPTDIPGNNYSLLVTGNATKTYPAPGKDWMTSGYTHVGLFVYGNGVETLTLKIVEGDFVSGAKVDETWTWNSSKPITLGWQYVTIPLPNFSPTEWSSSGGGDGIWNPRVTAPRVTAQEDGVKSITFIPSGSLYLDEITVSVPGNLEVDQIFPANDTTYTYRKVPPTFSAVISGTNLSLSDSIITIANADSQQNVLLNTKNPPPNTPNSGTTFDAIFATPNINVPLSSGTYNIFVTPIDSSGNIGTAAVSTFTLKKETLNSPIKTLYYWEVTQ